MKKTVLRFAVVLLSLAMVVGACGDSSGDGGVEGELTFALINGVLTGRESVCAFSGVKQALDDAGHKYVESSSVYNVDDEIGLVTSAITQGVDAILIWTAFPQSGLRDVTLANEADIPIYLFFNEVPLVTDQILGSSLYDFRGSGAAVGAWIAENRPNGVILELTGSPGSGTAENISQGILDGIAGSAVTVKQRENANWSADEAASLAATLLPGNPDINLVITHNDTMALAVQRVINDLGLTGDVEVLTESVSSPAGIQAVEDGIIPMPAFDPLAEYGMNAANHALELLGASTDERFRFIGPNLIDPEDPGAFCFGEE